MSSYRLDQAGRLIVGSVGQLEHGAYGLQKAWTLCTIAKTFPQVGPVDLEHGWYGTIAMTTNHIPRSHPISALAENFNPRSEGEPYGSNIPFIPPVKIFLRLELEQIVRFSFRH